MRGVEIALIVVIVLGILIFLAVRSIKDPNK
jgi:hypothetical protein